MLVEEEAAHDDTDTQGLDDDEIYLTDSEEPLKMNK